MHPKEIDSLKTHLRSIAESIVDSTKVTNPNDVFTTWFRGASKIVLLRPGYEELSALISTYAKKPRWSSVVSEKFLSDKFKKLALECYLNGEDSLAQHLSEFISTLNGPFDPSTVIFRVSGLHLPDMQPLQLGQVELCGGKPEQLRICLNARHPEVDDEVIEAWVNSIAEDGGDRVFALTQVAAELTRAQELARESVRGALELLTFGWAAVRLQLMEYSWPIVIEEDDFERLHVVYAASGRLGLHSSHQRIDIILPHTITSESFENLDQFHVLELFDRSESESSFTSSIRDAIHWFAVSKRQPEKDNRLLNLVTCFEALLSSNVPGAIGETVATNFAILLVEEPLARPGAIKRMKQLYDRRSRISHGDEVGVTDEELKELEYYAIRLILKLLPWRGSIKSKDELQNQLSNWKSDRMLGLSNAEDQFVPVAHPRPLAALRKGAGKQVDELADCLLDRKHFMSEDPREIDAVRQGWKDKIDSWERSGNQPNLNDIVAFSSALQVKPEAFLLPRNARLIRSHNYLMMLIAQKDHEGTWTASVRGIDWSEVKKEPSSPIDPGDPETQNPVYVSFTDRWKKSGEYRHRALFALERQIQDDLDRVI